MSQPNKLPMWVFRDNVVEENETTLKYTYVYKITAKLYMLEYVWNDGTIRNGQKDFVSFAKIKEWFFESETLNYEMMVYNPQQSIDKHYEFLQTIENNQQQPVIQPTPEMVVDEDPSSEDSEEPSE